MLDEYQLQILHKRPHQSLFKLIGRVSSYNGGKATLDEIIDVGGALGVDEHVVLTKYHVKNHARELWEMGLIYRVPEDKGDVYSLTQAGEFAKNNLELGVLIDE